MEIVGQLSGQMGDMVGGVVETVGEEPEPESEDIAEQHEEEEEELTKVCVTSIKSSFYQNNCLLNASFPVITGGRGNIYLGAGAVLFDPVPAER